MAVPSPVSVTELSDVFLTLQHWLKGAVILMARPIMIFTVSPIFTRAEFTPFLRNAVAIALIFPVLPEFMHILDQNEPEMLQTAFLAAKETLIGFVIGLAVSLPFWTLLVAGDMIDEQRGASQSRLSTPGEDEISVTSTLFIMSAIAVYVTSNGLDSLTGTIYDSWKIWRPLDMLPMPNDQAGVLALEFADSIFRRGFELASPIVIIMLLGDVAILLISRMTPQIHLDDVAKAAQNLSFSFMMPLYTGYLLYFERYDQMHLKGILSMIGGGLSHALPGPAVP